MQDGELREAIGLFDSLEKWTAFLTLCEKRDRIRQLMSQKAIQRLDEYFHSQLADTTWGYESFDRNSFGMVWYLREFGPQSICWVFHWGGVLALEVRGGNNTGDVAEITRLVRDTSYSELATGLERVDSRWDHNRLLKEEFNFHFDMPSDGHYGTNRLAWFAHYHTDQFMEQLKAKVARFQTPALTDMLRDLNQLTRKPRT